MPRAWVVSRIPAPVKLSTRVGAPSSPRVFLRPPDTRPDCRRCTMPLAGVVAFHPSNVQRPCRSPSRIDEQVSRLLANIRLDVEVTGDKPKLKLIEQRVNEDD